jgi:hypothetical protein
MIEDIVKELKRIGIKVLKFVIYALTLIACFAGIALMMLDSGETQAKKEKNLDDNIVVIEKGTNFKKYLDLETGCKWLEGPKGMSPYVKDSKYDCSKSYIDEYNKQHKTKQ